MPHGVGHHHHVHHHHHGGGFRVRHHHRHPYLYGGYYGYGYRRRPITWVIFSCAIAVIIILSTTMTVRYTASSDSDDSGLTYGPTDTRLISVNRAFCGAVKIKMDLIGDSSAGYLVYLYSLSSPPQLVDSETVNEHPTVDMYTTYISFMPKGSSFSMSACLLSNDELYFTFYVVKGKQNYGTWKDNRWEGDTSTVDRTLTIRTSCDTGNDTLSYSVTEDDFLYLIFETYDDSYSSEDLNVTINYHQRRYELGNGTVLDSCYLNSIDYFSSCSVGLPLTGSSATLLQVEPDGSEIGLSDSVSVDAYCVARVWMYVLLSLIILVTVVGCFVGLTICLYCFCIKKKKRVTTAAAGAGVTTEQSVNTPLLQDTATAPPPPFTDPVYPQSTASTSYGSNYYAPPTYKE